jgi:hypothetical protein
MAENTDLLPDADSNASLENRRGVVAHDRPEEERRDKRGGDDTVPRRPNDEVPANRREDPRNEDRDLDIERPDRRRSS